MSTPASTAVKELSWFLTAPQERIVRRCQGLPSSITLKGPKGHGPIVFIPGTHPTRILLVAHYDTVWDKSFKETPVRVRFTNGLFFSTTPKVGIGADDRAGCAMIWLLRSLGHSMLFVPGEETGCHGSRYMLEEYPSHLKGHHMALEFDRRGNDDIATYDCHNLAHVEYLQQFFPGYTKTHGSSTDIRHLGPAMGVASANLSVGFYSEHTDRERLRLGDFLHCYWGAQDLLTQDKIPLFEHKTLPAPTYYTGKDYSKSANSTSPAIPIHTHPAGARAANAKKAAGAAPSEIASSVRAALNTLPSSTGTGAIIVANQRSAYFFMLNSDDTPVPVDSDTGEGFCETCRRFIHPDIAHPGADHVLQCPECGDPLHTFFC